MIDTDKIRSDFPIFNNGGIVYLDNAATTQKPEQVLTKIDKYYRELNSNIHRGEHYLSRKASVEYEESRTAVKKFINAGDEREVIFTRGTTEAINLIARCYGDKYVNEKDEIIISNMEHHSNIVPWQRLCKRNRAVLKVLPFNDKGDLLIDRLEDLITEKTKMIALTQVSNVLGTVNPIKKIIHRAHSEGIPVLIDGAQSIQHLSVDVGDLDCDFFVFSGHKMYASTGTGVLYGKEKWLEKLPPYETGGGMVKKVSLEKSKFEDIPLKFEAGTPNIAGILSFKAAIDYIQNIGMKEIKKHEEKISKYLTQELLKLKGVEIYGNSDERVGVVSFNLDGIHPYDAGVLLDRMKIAVRTGTHCAQPVMDHYGIPGALRASLAFYNNEEDVDILIEGIKKVNRIAV